MSEPVKIVVLVQDGCVVAVSSLGVPIQALIVDCDCQDEDDADIIASPDNPHGEKHPATVQAPDTDVLSPALIAALEPFWGG